MAFPSDKKAGATLPVGAAKPAVTTADKSAVAQEAAAEENWKNAQVRSHEVSTKLKPTAATPGNTDPTKLFKILRGQYTRRENRTANDAGAHVHYQAGTDNDMVEMTENEANKFGRRFLAEVSAGGIVKPSLDQIAYLEDQEKARTRTASKGAEVN